MPTITWIPSTDGGLNCSTNADLMVFQCANTALATDAANLPVISYRYFNNKSLKVAHTISTVAIAFS